MDVEKFIGAIYIRTSLWDKKDINHHNRYILDKLWKEVGREFNISRDCARGRWKALRDKYRSTLVKISQRQLSSDGDINDCIVSWPYFRSLSFLKEQFAGSNAKTRESSTYSDSLQDDNEKSNDNFQESALNGFSDPVEKFLSPTAEFLVPRNNLSSPAVHDERSEKQSQLLGKRAHKNEHIVRDLINVENKKLKFLKSLNDKVESTDEDVSFFNSIIPHLKNLNSMDKMSFRIQVLRCVQEILAQKNGNPTETTNTAESIVQVNGQPYTITVSSGSSTH